MNRMAAMHPHFLRLPGDNYLEGTTLEDWYDWKKTIGPVVDRPGHQAPWFYWSTDGLGLLEFLARGISCLEAYRYIYSQLRVATDSKKILMAFGDGRIGILTG